MVTWFPFLLSMTFLSVWRVAHTGRGEHREGEGLEEGRRERERQRSYYAQSMETCHNTSGGSTPMGLHKGNRKIANNKTRLGGQVKICMTRHQGRDLLKGS